MERNRGTGSQSFLVTIEESFSAAHALKGYRGDCERLHGHNWTVKATVSSDKLDRLGLVIDFRVLRRFLGDILSELDHSNLTEHPYFSKTNPSAENIAKYCFDILEPSIQKCGCNLVRVDVSETPNSMATYQK